MPAKPISPESKGYSAQNRVKLVHGGKEYFDILLQLVNRATDTIHLHTYIFDDDDTGTLVAAALKEAVKRNVKVYLLVDGYASRVMGHSFAEDLKNAGIHFRYFQPLFKSKYFYFGRRLHHKLVVTDTRFALVGGLNITNRYNDLPGHPAWLDFAVLAEGEVAKELCVLCWKTWKEFPKSMGLTPCELKPPHFNFPSEGTSLVRMRRNDWVRGKNQISRSYLEMLRDAKSHITILCSYFLPGRLIRRNLVNASKRGVKIRVILASLSDVPVAKQAERYIYQWMLRNRIEIYEYKGAVLHGKVATYDKRWVTVGSYNVNNLSAYASIELNLDIQDAQFAQRAEEELEKIMREQCIQVRKEDLLRRDHVFRKLIHWISYQLIKAGIFLFTFYFRRRT